jgi:hypothetical protein
MMPVGRCDQVSTLATGSGGKYSIQLVILDYAASVTCFADA